VVERIKEFVVDAKKVKNNINKELTKHKLETESGLTNIRSELSNVRQGVAEETLNAI
jgi:hypothetical protein